MFEKIRMIENEVKAPKPMELDVWRFDNNLPSSEMPDEVLSCVDNKGNNIWLVKQVSEEDDTGEGFEDYCEIKHGDCLVWADEVPFALVVAAEDILEDFSPLSEKKRRGG